MVFSYDKRGFELSQCRHFADKGSIFRDFVRTFYMNGPFQESSLE